MRKILLATTIIVAGFAFSSGAMAQMPPAGGETNVGGTEPTNIPGHSRVDQVDQRDNNQQQRIDKGEADGQLSQGQAARDQSHLDHQEATQQKQEGANGGHLTKGEQHHDNKSLNKSSHKIRHQRRGGCHRHHKH
jgi:hypothetical protein